MEKKRYEYLDMAKGIGIILVVLGHIVYTEPHIMVWISSFHMPLFFVVAGVIMALSGGEISDLRFEIGKRAKGLLVPYLWFSLIDFILDIGNVLLGKIDVHTFVVNIISSVTFYGKSVLWFLVALFLAQVYFLFLRRYLKNYLVIIGVVVIAAISYGGKLLLEEAYKANENILAITSAVNFGRTFVRAGITLPFLAAGFYIWLLVDIILKRVNAEKIKFKRLIGLFIGVALLAVNIICAMANWSVDTNNLILGNPALYYVGGIMGSFAVVIICKNLPVIRIITYFGRNSLVVMATHLDCYILWAGLKIGMMVYGVIQMASVFVGVSVILTLCMSIVPIEIINRFFPFIIGKKRHA